MAARCVELDRDDRHAQSNNELMSMVWVQLWRCKVGGRQPKSSVTRGGAEQERGKTWKAVGKSWYGK